MLFHIVLWCYIIWSVVVTTAWTTSPDLLLVPRPSSLDSVPLKLWANARKAVLRPRSRDLHQSTLMAALQPHYDPKWMSLSKPQRQPANQEPGERRSTAALREAAANLPFSDTLREWLVSRASCPVSFTWSDLGHDFWPRYVKTATCPRPAVGTCSWPPGMSCLPAPPKNLQILRWHCRLRKNSRKKKPIENNVWTGNDKKAPEPSKKRKGRRRKYRCMWVKASYPVPGDCVCGCG
ncbi:noggin-like isoform X1 [Rhodnius prolixus]|uniref:noggin-like isoform X1 n=1 Tax=Rhodnius prolixus TaxID=13249 RepID=UPI003D18C277